MTTPVAPGEGSPGHEPNGPTNDSLATSRQKRSIFDRLFWGVVALCGMLALWFAYQQIRDAQYVATVAWRVVREARAETPRDRVIALRDFLRRHVSYEGAPQNGRPFLRASAGETLRSRLGYCGDVTRTLICMAAAVGIPAQRINLWGAEKHVVAEVELPNRQRFLVDCQNPPMVADLEPLDRVILRPEFDDYYTINLRRLGIGWLVSRVKLQLGPLTFWTKNPHAMRATGWGLLGLFLVLIRVSVNLARSWLRRFLRRRGWVHISDRAALSERAEP